MSLTLTETKPPRGGEMAKGRVMADGGNSPQSSLAMRDLVTRQGEEVSTPQLLAHAAKESGRGVLEITREQRRLQKGRGRLSLQEYVRYAVYDRAGNSPEEQSRFIGENRRWPITQQCCDMTWQAATDDKWLAAHFLRDSAIPVPQTLAVIDQSRRLYPGTQKLSTPSDLRDFALHCDLPIFGKANRSVTGAGVFLIDGADDDGLHLRGEGYVEYDTFLYTYLGAVPYLLQPVVGQHSYFDRYTDALATVRVNLCLRETDVHVPFCVLNLPALGNIADNFWRPGNVFCGVDPHTGRVYSARSLTALGTADHEAHPHTGEPLIGEVLPHWSGLRALAEATAQLFAHARFQSMDIAITADGPMLIKVTTGGGFQLPQLASGQGFLTDEVIAFFSSLGVADL